MSSPSKPSAAQKLTAEAKRDDLESDDEEFLSGFNKLTLHIGPNQRAVVEEEWQCEQKEEEVDYILHIDIVGSWAYDFGRWINSYMLRHYNYDPRRYQQFFDVQFAPETPTLRQMRETGNYVVRMTFCLFL